MTPNFNTGGFLLRFGPLSSDTSPFGQKISALIIIRTHLFRVKSVLLISLPPVLGWLPGMPQDLVVLNVTLSPREKIQRKSDTNILMEDSDIIYQDLLIIDIV